MERRCSKENPRKKKSDKKFLHHQARANNSIFSPFTRLRFTPRNPKLRGGKGKLRSWWVVSSCVAFNFRLPSPATSQKSLSRIRQSKGFAPLLRRMKVDIAFVDIANACRRSQSCGKSKALIVDKRQATEKWEMFSVFRRWFPSLSA